MQLHSIREPLDVVEHSTARGRVAVKQADGQLGLERREEALHRSIIPAVAFTTHTAARAQAPPAPGRVRVMVALTSQPRDVQTGQARLLDTASP